MTVYADTAAVQQTETAEVLEESEVSEETIEQEVVAPIGPPSVEKTDEISEKPNGKDFSNEIFGRDLSPGTWDYNNFPLAGFLDPSNGRVLNPELLPGRFTNIVRDEQSQVFVNDRRITSTTNLSNGNVLEFRNLLAVNLNTRVNATWQIGPQSGRVNPQIDPVNFEMRTSGPLDTGTVNASVEYSYAETGELLDVYPIFNYGLFVGPSLELAKDDFHALFVSDSINRIWGDINLFSTGQLVLGGQYSLGDVHHPINIITNPNFLVTLHLIGGGLYPIYSQQGVQMTFSYDDPEIIGETEEERFVSRYNVRQTIPEATFADMTILAELSTSLLEPEQLLVRDQNGKDITSETIIEWDQNSSALTVRIPAERLLTLRGTNISFEIVAPLTKGEALNQYLSESGYVEVPITVQNDMSNAVTVNALTWARPWGDAVPQEVSLGDTSNEFDPADFVTNLENKLEGDHPFVVGFSEEKSFDELGETTVNVVIESEISGIQNTIEVPVTVKNKGRVFVHHVNQQGEALIDSELIEGRIGEAYKTEPEVIENYRLLNEPDNTSGIFTEEDIDVTYIYDIAPIKPVDPLDPEEEVNPENPPVIPEDQGLISIDFVSQFNFGEVPIRSGATTYNALPQSLLNEDSTASEEERPNYIQISDRRAETTGWELTARLSEEGFRTAAGEQLKGARILLENTEMVTTRSNEGTEPFYNSTAVLEPGILRSLAVARNSAGRGTWIQRYGNQETAASSVKLDVPVGVNPKATFYEGTIEWQLSFTPGNE